MDNQNTPSPVEWVMNDFCRLIKLLPNQIFLIQFPPMSDKTVVLTHVKLHVTQEPSHNIQVHISKPHQNLLALTTHTEPIFPYILINKYEQNDDVPNSRFTW